MNNLLKNKYDNFNIKKLNSDGIIALSNRIKVEMLKHGISIKKLSKFTKLNENIIQEWYDNDGDKTIDIDVLAIICCVLSKKITNFLE